MRLLGILSLAALGACASSGSAPTTSQPSTQTVRIDGVGALNTSVAAPTGNVQTLPYAIEAVWRVLPAVYDSLAIPVTRADAAQHVLANDGLKGRQRLGKVSFSRYIDCGNTQMGPSADNYEIFLSIATQLRSTGPASTQVETALDASAKPIQFSQSPSRCTTRGALEPRVAALLTTLLASAPAR